MTQPTRSDVHVSAPLTNISLAYIQSANDFVSGQMFPMVPVQKQGDKYFVYDKAQWFKSDARLRAPATESAGSGFSLSVDSYFADVFAIHMDVADQIRSNQDQPLDMDRDATLFVARQMLLKKEKDFLSKFMTTGVWGSDVTPGVLWDASGSDPVKDVRTYKRAVKNATGFSPNKMMVSSNVHDILMDHPVILDRIKYTQRGQISKELIASILELDQYLVAEALENTAAEGQTATLASMCTKDALLAYVAPAPGIMIPSAGYTFGWSGYTGMADGQRVSKFRMDPLKADRIEGEMAYDLKKVGADLGIFLNNVIS